MSYAWDERIDGAPPDTEHAPGCLTPGPSCEAKGGGCIVATLSTEYQQGFLDGVYVEKRRRESPILPTSEDDQALVSKVVRENTPKTTTRRRLVPNLGCSDDMFVEESAAPNASVAPRRRPHDGTCGDPKCEPCFARRVEGDRIWAQGHEAGKRTGAENERERSAPSSSPAVDRAWPNETWLELRVALEGVLPLIDRFADYAHDEECDTYNDCENGEVTETCPFDEEKDEHIHNHHSCKCGIWDMASKAKDVRAILDRTTPPAWRKSTQFTSPAKGDT